MTTAGVLELRGNGKKVFIYGVHDSYPEGWPSLAVKWLVESRGDLETVAREVLERLRDWDFEGHMKYDYEMYHYKHWKETEKEIRRISAIDFRFISENDIPQNLEKDWDYWYVIDINKNEITVKQKSAVECPSQDESIVVCGEQETVQFKGALEEFLSKYS
ncbi:MAG: hypothetical protein QW317_11860 [Thermoproteus sp.]